MLGPVRDKHKKHGTAREAEEMCDDLDRVWSSIFVPRNQNNESPRARHPHVIRTFRISILRVLEPNVFAYYLCSPCLRYFWSTPLPLHYKVD